MNAKIKLIVVNPFIVKTKKEKKRYKANDKLEVSQEIYEEIKSYVKVDNNKKNENTEE